MAAKPSVTGVGGVFFKARDPRALAEWYREHLGVPIESGMNHAVFSAHGAEPNGAPVQTVWSTFPADTRYFGSGDAPFMLNYRVADLEAVLARLRAEGVAVDERVESSEYGRFGWATDPEGNRFELWEPPKPPAPGDPGTSALLREAAGRGIRYLETLPDRRVAPDPVAVEQLARFEEPLPEGPVDPAEVLRLLDEVGSPATMGMAGGRFFGFVIGGALPVTVAASWLATAWDQNTGLWNATPATATLEEVALRWMVELFGLPPGTGGSFVTGATVANFTALAAARHAVLQHAGWDVEAQGLYGAPTIQVVVGEEAHPTVIKSLGLLGLGRRRVAVVPTDGQGRIRADRLPALEAPAIVCVQAGNVNTGAIDPLEELIARARAAGAWVHVDAAFGLWAAAAPSRAPLVAGIAGADSWATDAHKWLNVPYDSGLAFVRDPHALRAAMSITAEYLPTDTPRRNPSDHTPELSRRARGVEVWAALRALGRRGVADLIERTCAHARRFAAGLEAAGYEVLNDVVLNQVLVAFGDAAATERAIARLQDEGTCWCGGTVWQGRTAMRISVSSWATTEADVDKSLAAMIQAARS